MNKKIIWLVTLFLLVAGTFAEAQQTGKVFRIGFLDQGTALDKKLHNRRHFTDSARFDAQEEVESD